MGDLQKNRCAGLTGPTQLHVWGIDHRHATATERERVHLDAARARAFMETFAREQCGVSSVVLCTCNRTEIYLEVSSGCRGRSAFAKALCEVGIDGEAFFKGKGLHLTGFDAVRHLYRVSSGLESMVLGEYQIQAQVKAAYRLAEESHERLGPILRKAFQGALKAGKRVRTETELGSGPVSVAYAAVEEARNRLNGMKSCRGLMIGAGKTGSLAARHFLRLGVGPLTIVSRTMESSERIVDKLSEEHEGRICARPFQELQDALAEADVIISATASPEPIIDRALLERSRTRCNGAPLLIFDIAVPRDVHPDVCGLEFVRLTGIDELSGVVRRYEGKRREEIPEAERLIESELEEFLSWGKTLRIKPTVVELKSHLEDLAAKEIGYARRRHSPATAEAVENSLRVFVDKLLQRPVRNLKTNVSEADRERDLKTLQRLFALSVPSHNSPRADEM